MKEQEFIQAQLHTLDMLEVFTNRHGAELAPQELREYLITRLHNTVQLIMDKGKYYIGDLCYVTHRGQDSGFYPSSWNYDCNSTDTEGRVYVCDSGSYGIMPLEDIDWSKIEVTLDESDNAVCGTPYDGQRNVVGHVVEFENDFEINFERGVFDFGEFSLDTGACN